MTMKRFAKLLETPSTQVLVYLDYDDDQDCTSMKVVMVLDNGTRSQIGFGFTGDDQEEKALKALDGFTVESALKLLNPLNKTMGKSP